MTNGVLTIINKSGGLKSFTRLLLLLVCAVWTLSATAQTVTVTGTVTDQTGDPMPGVAVIIKGTTTGVSTDIDGKYSLKASKGSTLEFTYIGYHNIKVTVGNNPVIDVEMKEDISALDEVVVVAYGTQKKSSITGAISQINSKDIESRPVSSVTSALEGASSGISVTGAVGQPGSDVSISIRGVGTVNGSNSPLIVFDGVPYDGNISDISPDDIESISVLKDAASCALYGNRASNGVIMLTSKKSKTNKPTFTFKTTQGWYERGQEDYNTVNPFQFMEVEYADMYNNYISGEKLDRTNPADRATAHAYTLKNLKSERTMINIFNSPIEDIFTEDGKIAEGVSINPLYADDLDWYDQSIRRGYRAEYAFSGAGATEHSDYYFSLNHLTENGYTKDADFKRLTGRAVINLQPRSWFKAGLQINASHQKSTNSQGDTTGDSSSSTTNPFYFYRNIAPIYPVHLHDEATGAYILDDKGNKVYDPGYYDYTDENGNLKEVDTRKQLQGNHSIWESEMNRDRVIRNTTNSTAYSDFYLPWGLTFTLKGNLSTRNQESTSLGSSVIGGAAKGSNGKLSKTVRNEKTWTFQQQLNWNRTFNAKHYISVLLGHENYSWSRDYTYGRKQDINIEGLPALNNFNTITDLNGYRDRYRTESYLARVQYSYDDRYNIEGSFRRDGSSRFAKDIRWGNFGSIGANWLFTAEDFMKGQTWITNGKLRVNWGQVGNDAGASRYAYYDLYDMGIKGGYAAYVMSQLAAGDLQWETGESWGVAIEARLFNRWNLSVEYYDKRNKDLIFDVYNPLSSGGTSFDAPESTITKNLGTISNRGIEINTDFTVFSNRDWSVNIAANLTTLTNKIVKLPEQNKDGIITGIRKIVEGKSRYQWYTYHWAGVDMMDGMSLYDANLDDYHIVAENGDIIGGRYEDGNLISEPLKAENYKLINGKYYVNTTTYAKRDFRGCSLPKFNGSVTANVSWRNFNLSAMMTYSVGGKVYDSSYASLMSINSKNVTNYHVDILNSWSGVPEGMTETSPDRINSGINPIIDHANTYNNSSSDRFLISRNYVTLKNINLTYRLPKSVLQPLTLTSANVFFSAENVVTNTKRQGLAVAQNPGGYVYNMMPLPRIYTFGLNVSF